jgi:hypothetical protein
MTQIAACVPVELGKKVMPEFPAVATYSTYRKVACPICSELMWLGAKVEALVKAGEALAVCMMCLPSLGLENAPMKSLK